MSESLHAFALFFSLLNPFLMSIYMLGIIRNSEARVFNRALIQGSLISFVVFIIFAKTGEAFFHDVLHVRFESFQIFGGIIFLVIFVTLFLTCSLLILMKYAHDHLQHKHSNYIDLYVDIVGRLAALLIGTIAIDMIVTGVSGIMQS